MTYTELEKDGMNLAEVALGDMMDIVEEQTGRFPHWTDTVPDWIMRNFGYETLPETMSDEQIETVLNEAESIGLTESPIVYVYVKRNDDDEVIDMMWDYHRNDCAEQNRYHIEYVFRA